LLQRAVGLFWVTTLFTALQQIIQLCVSQHTPFFLFFYSFRLSKCDEYSDFPCFSAAVSAFMRIIGGTAGGRTLKVPKGLAVRPTPDRVRQAIFNSLRGLIEGASILELFGGSGALSLESLSRGAKSATCIEMSSKHAAFIRSNFRESGLKNHNFTVRVQDVFPAIAQLSNDTACFDLIMADPPFGDKNTGTRSKSFSQRLLDDPNLPGLIAADGFLILGHAKRDSLEIPPIWNELKALKHGDSIFRILAVTGKNQEQPSLEPGV